MSVLQNHRSLLIDGHFKWVSWIYSHFQRIFTRILWERKKEKSQIYQFHFSCYWHTIEENTEINLNPSSPPPSRTTKWAIKSCRTSINEFHAFRLFFCMQNQFPAHKSILSFLQFPFIIFPQWEKILKTENRKKKSIKIYYRHNTKGEEKIKVNGRKFIT